MYIKSIIAGVTALALLPSVAMSDQSAFSKNVDSMIVPLKSVAFKSNAYPRVNPHLVPPAERPPVRPKIYNEPIELDDIDLTVSQNLPVTPVERTVCQIVFDCYAAEMRSLEPLIHGQFYEMSIAIDANLILPERGLVDLYSVKTGIIPDINLTSTGFSAYGEATFRGNGARHDISVRLNRARNSPIVYINGVYAPINISLCNFVNSPEGPDSVALYYVGKVTYQGVEYNITTTLKRML